MDMNLDVRDLASMHHAALVIMLWLSPLARQTAMQETQSLSLALCVLGVVPACSITTFLADSSSHFLGAPSWGVLLI